MFRYYVLAFLSGTFIMALELVAGRLIAPFLGVSLYTWTSIIGVVLAGISAGSFIGGWMADRFPPRRLLGYVLMLAGILSASILPALPVVMDIRWPAWWWPVLKVVVPVSILFGVPSFILGAVSPLIYRICLTDLRRTGSTVGKLAASGSLGSIAGTFAAGFWLIPTFGTRTIIFVIAGCLIVLGVITSAWSRKRKTISAITLTILMVYFGSSPLAAVLRPPGQRESAYYTIRVATASEPGVGTVKKLVLDSLVHSAASPDQPEYLWYEYERIAAWVISEALGKAPRAFFIGGGGYTLPYWLEHFAPEAAIEVAEIDPAVTETALREFISPSTRIVTHNMDARMVFKNLPRDQKYDFIFGDAFNDLSVPYHLTTREFDAVIRDRLSPKGIYVANLVDKPSGPFLGAFAYTASHVFPYVYILPAAPGVLEGNRGPNLVVAALEPLPWDQWYPSSLDLPFEVRARAPLPSKLLLTDDFAPVDNLLLPVFADRLR